MFEALDAFLKTQDGKIEVKRDCSLSLTSTIGIGPKVPYLLCPYSASSLIALLSILYKEKIPYIISGRMSNTLFTDNASRSVVIRTDKMCRVRIDGTIIFAECGTTLALLKSICLSEELTGLEELFGIPGSIGAGVVGNAGAFGRELADTLLRVKVYSVESEEQYILDASDMDFSYRCSSLKGKECVLLGAQISLAKGCREEMLNKIAEYRQMRLRTQPVGKKSLGSTFKRCNGRSAGELIDLCGLKGTHVNDACISRKHAGFIVNEGNATASNVVSLMNIAQCAVEKSFGLKLEPEIVVM